MDRYALVKEFATHFRKITKTTRTEFLHILNNYIPFNEFIILRILEDRNSLMVSQIAEKLEVSNSHVTATTEKLVKKGFLTRERCEQDRRVVYLSITDEGIALVQKMEVIIQDYFTEKLKDLSEEELFTAIGIFKKILE